MCRQLGFPTLCHDSLAVFLGPFPPWKRQKRPHDGRGSQKTHMDQTLDPPFGAVSESSGQVRSFSPCGVRDGESACESTERLGWLVLAFVTELRPLSLQRATDELQGSRTE